jgi:hypothetical protein
MPRVSIVWVILLAAIAALAGYWAWREHALAAAAALRVQTAEQRLDAADRRVVEFGHRAAAAESARATAEAKLTTAGSSPAGASAADSRKQVHLRDLVRDHPELEAARMIILRRDALRNLGDRLARLNLPPDKLAQLENLLVERTLAASDAATAAHDAGLVEGTAEYYKATANAQKDVETEIDALIGKDQERQLIGGASYKYQVDTLEASLAESGAALTPDQQYTLSNLMDGVNRAGAPRGVAAQDYFQADPSSGLSGKDKALLDKAADQFSPEQVEALRNAIISNNRDEQAAQAIFKVLPSGSGFVDD